MTISYLISGFGVGQLGFPGINHPTPSSYQNTRVVGWDEAIA